MWDLIVSVPDHCLSFYSVLAISASACVHVLQSHVLLLFPWVKSVLWRSLEMFLLVLQNNLKTDACWPSSSIMDIHRQGAFLHLSREMTFMLTAVYTPRNIDIVYALCTVTCTVARGICNIEYGLLFELLRFFM